MIELDTPAFERHIYQFILATISPEHHRKSSNTSIIATLVKPANLLTNLPIGLFYTDELFHTVSLDFITELPFSADDKDALLIVIDKFTKLYP